MLFDSRRIDPPLTGGIKTTPELVIAAPAWRKIITFASLCPNNNEINGYAYISLHNGNFHLADPADVFITKQTVSPGAANVTGTDAAKALDRAVLDGRADDLRLQWHSHAKADVSFSVIDVGTIRNYGDVGMEWFVSLVVNHKHKALARVDQFRPFQTGGEIGITIYDPISPEVIAACQADIDELVSEKTVVVAKKTTRRSRGSRLSVVKPKA